VVPGEAEKEPPLLELWELDQGRIDGVPASYEPEQPHEADLPVLYGGFRGGFYKGWLVMSGIADDLRIANDLITEVMAGGVVTHPDDGWRAVPVEAHLDHAWAHLFLWFMGDKSQDHLAHAFTRLFMAVVVSKGVRQ
jgi:hypothetical protein